MSLINYSGREPPSFSRHYHPVVSIYNYDPSVLAAFFGIACFTVITCIHVWWFASYRAFHAWTLVLGLLLECAGHAARVISVRNKTDAAAYFASYIFILSAPAFLAIACYITFGRIVSCITPLEKNSAIELWFPSSSITPLLAMVTLAASLIQIIGVTITASVYNKDLIWAGKGLRGLELLKAGLIIELVCLAFFMTIGIRYMVISHGWGEVEPAKRNLRPGMDCDNLQRTMQLAILLIAVRTAFRLIEAFQSGPSALGDLLLEEWPIWAFDFLPILAVAVVLAIVHPGKHLPSRFRAIILRKERLDLDIEGKNPIQNS